MDSKFYFTIGILVLIVVIALAIGIYFSDSFWIKEELEGFQSLNKQQITDMSKCTMDMSGCMNINYYDEKGILQNGNFLNLPDNFYLDSNNTLQSVPYGNIVTPDYRGYRADTSNNISTYSAIAHLGDNAIANPKKCNQRQIALYYPVTKTVCTKTKYITMNGNTPVVNEGQIIIPDGYYYDSSDGFVKVVPYGYVSEPNKLSITITSDFSKQVSSTSYDQNNLDLTYHTDSKDISTYSDSSTAGAGKMWVLDESGNLISIPYSDMSGSTLYNEPGSFRFGSSNYVPNYEESVYLSKLTNISTVTPVINSAENAAGFCSALYPDTNALEQACNALDTNACGSTSCCTLLGGQKCVYGSDKGPYFKSNYSNFMVTNPEFYYYQGKCYGNCQDQGNHVMRRTVQNPPRGN